MLKLMKVLLLQYRDGVTEEHEQKCIIDRSGLDESNFTIRNALRDSFEDFESLVSKVDKVIIGGSAQYDISSRDPELIQAIKVTSPLLTYLLKNDIPTLGICLGHQLLAQEIGAKVLNIKELAEDYTETMFTTDSCSEDPLMKNITPNLKVHLGHKDSVIFERFPNEIEVLGFTPKGALGAFRYKQNIYGVQFHPELNANDMYERTLLYPEYSPDKTKDEIRAALSEATESNTIIKRFLDLAN